MEENPTPLDITEGGVTVDFTPFAINTLRVARAKYIHHEGTKNEEFEDRERNLRVFVPSW